MGRLLDKYLTQIKEDEEDIDGGEEGGNTLPQRFNPRDNALETTGGLPHELRVRLMSEINHMQKQPHKYLRLMNDFMHVLTQIQQGHFLTPQEAENFLNKYKEFDKDVKNPRYFKLLREFLTTGNWNFARFKGQVR